MASPAQIIRHKFLNTFFSRHSLVFMYFYCAQHHMVSNRYTPHSIYYFISDTLLNGLWVVTGVLSLLGLYDVLQNKHSILRNYPIMTLSFLFEDIRPEIRQYFIEADQDVLYLFLACNEA